MTASFVVMDKSPEGALSGFTPTQITPSDAQADNVGLRKSFLTRAGSHLSVAKLKPVPVPAGVR
jgi:hypothetical protein